MVREGKEKAEVNLVSEFFHIHRFFSLEWGWVCVCKLGWKERLKGFFVAKASSTGNKSNGGIHIPPTPKNTLLITYVWSVIVIAVMPRVKNVCVSGKGNEDYSIFKFYSNFIQSYSNFPPVFQILMQKDANQRLIHCRKTQCCELMFMSWWLSHGWRRKSEMKQCFY